jgi:hypothetical protein
MLTREEASEIAFGAIAHINLGKDADYQVVVYEERTVERDLVFGFFCNTKNFKETSNPRHALLVQITPTKPLGWLRQALGDVPVSAILVRRGRLTDAQIERAVELFPEARIIKDSLRIQRSSAPERTDGIH